MNFSRMVRTIDSHTCGQPTRTITGGLPRIPGNTMGEKMAYLRDNQDSLRKFLMFEPRGNEVMSGAIITEPTISEADVGVIYIEVGGYLPMCGHDTIGLVTALLETGFIETREPETYIALDTPAGLVRITARVRDGKCQSVAFCNVPAFLFAEDILVKVPELGELKLDISYGGNVYAIVKAEDAGLEIEPSRAAEIIAKGKKIRVAVNEQVKIQHPEKDFINQCTHVEFSGPSTHPEADQKNVVVIPPGAIDRSPCGTGTAAKLAALYSRGKVKLGQEFVHESIIGTLFRSKILEVTEIKDIPAVVTEIKGRAFITGFNNLVLDPEDPLAEGFLLGK